MCAFLSIKCTLSAKCIFKHRLKLEEEAIISKNKLFAVCTVSSTLTAVGGTLSRVFQQTL